MKYHALDYPQILDFLVLGQKNWQQKLFEQYGKWVLIWFSVRKKHPVVLWKGQLAPLPNAD